MGKKMIEKTDTLTQEKVKLDNKEPGFYKVVFINDDVTPMEFVIDVLQKVFRHSQNVSTEIMLAIHNNGSAVAGIYTYEIAEEKGIETTVMARNSGFPLQVKIEKE
jgi:ATP-dependent Clp protease adaptor protein ClpS